MFTPKNLRLNGYVEAISMLLLIGLAMPVKYLLGEPILVRYIGSAHGILFIWYVVFLALTVKRNPMPWWAFPLGLVGAVIPAGPFIFEALLARSLKSQTAN